MNKYLIVFIIGLLFISIVLVLAGEFIIIEPYQSNPELISFNVEIDNGVKISYKDYSATFIPYFVMKNGVVYEWQDIPSSIQKDLWRTKQENNRYKYGVDFSNIPTTIKNNLNYVVLHLSNSTGLTWDDIRLEGNTIIIKDKVYIFHDDILRTYAIPVINKTDIVIGGLDNSWQECIEYNPETLDCINEITKSNWIDNGDGTWNISFDPQIIISEDTVVTTSILNNVTAETGDSNFTHLSIDNTTSPYDSLVGYWNFDGDKENTLGFTAYDFSQYNYDGIASGNVVVNSSCSLYGNGACFNGISGNSINISSKVAIFSNNFAITAWVKTNTVGSTTSQIVYSGTNEQFYRYEDDLIYRTTSYDTTIASTVFSTGIWCMVTVTYNGTQVSIYVNGNEVVNETKTATDGDRATTIGHGYTAEGWNGLIDEVMIFNTTLTDAQILDIYNNQSSRFAAEGTQTIPSIDLCYQEYANVSTDCGGASSGVYWNETNYIYINYSKPDGFTGAVWKVSHGTPIFDNYTIAIPSDCFNDPIQLRFYASTEAFGVATSYGQCKNSIDWENITEIKQGDGSGGWETGGIEHAIDGNWGTGSTYDETVDVWGDASGDDAYIGEEGIYWLNDTNRINVTTFIENNFGSSINLTLGYYNVSGWFYTEPQTVSSGSAIEFNVSSVTTTLNLNYTFYAGNDTNPFYSPILKDNVTLDTWSEEEVSEDTTPPNIEYVEPTGTSGNVLKINITASDTQSNISIFTDIDNDLLLWLRMDELNASNDIIDNSTYQDTCIAVGGQQITDGSLGSAWKPINIDPFTSDQDAINCGNSKRFEFEQLTVSGWFNILGDLGGNTQSGIRKGENFVNPYIDAGFTTITSWIKTDVNWYQVTALTSPSEIKGKWTNIVSTYNKSDFSIYVNGILENTTSASGNIKYNESNLWIGKEVTGATQLYFNGSFDDILIFNRSLEALEIEMLYANQTSKDFYIEYNFGAGTYNYTSYAQDTAGNVNYTINITELTICDYSSGNWDISSYCEFSNQNINIDGNLSILNGGTLNGTNVSLNFTSISQWIIFENIADGDKLILTENSRIN